MATNAPNPLGTQVTTSQIQYYTPADPYYYTIDNRPLGNLETQIQTIVGQVDLISVGRVDITVSAGAISATNSLPTGWSGSRTGTGVYQVTTGLTATSNSNMSIFAQAYGGSTPLVTLPAAVTSGTITVTVYNLSAAATDPTGLSIWITRL